MAFPVFGADLREGTKINNGFVFDSLTILSPTTTLDFRASMTRWVQDYKPTNWGDYDATVIGWSKDLVSRLPEPNRFPTFIDQQLQDARPVRQQHLACAHDHAIALAPTLTAIRGRHSLKFGLDFRSIRYANYQSIGTGGTSPSTAP